MPRTDSHELRDIGWVGDGFAESRAKEESEVDQARGVAVRSAISLIDCACLPWLPC